LQQNSLDFWKLFSNNLGMAKKPQHGGKRPGAGRPAKPASERRDQVFSIKLTAGEKQLLDAADARTWARDTLLKAAKQKC
jgi:hypothetical protein